MGKLINRDPNSFFSKNVNTIETKVILKKWKENPEQLIQYLDMRNKFWRKMRNEVPNSEYEKSFIFKLYEKYGQKKELINSVLDFGGSFGHKTIEQGAQLGKILVESGDLISKMEANERIALAKNIMGDPVAMASVMRTLEERPLWRVAIGQGVSYSRGKLRESWVDIMNSDYDYFYGPNGLNLSTNVMDLVGELSPYDQFIEALDYKEFLSSDVRETNIRKLNLIEKDLKSVELNLGELSNSFNDFIDKELKNEKEEQEAYKEQLRINECKGYAQLLGYVVGIKDPKLGYAISQGTSALIDAYTSFETFNKLATVASLASGVGSFLTVVSIVQGFGSSQEDQVSQMLMEGIRQINENISHLREEIQENFKYTFEKLDTISESLRDNQLNIDLQLDNISNLINEFTKRDLESDFQLISNDIYADYESVSNYSTEQQLFDVLNKLYTKAINYSSVEKYTRMNESDNNLFDYLDLEPKFANDSFKWSPIEYRPILITKLIEEIVETDIETRFKDLHKTLIDEEYSRYKENPPLKDNKPDQLKFTHKSTDLDWDIINKYYETKEDPFNPISPLSFRLKDINAVIEFSPLLIEARKNFKLFKIDYDLKNLTLNSFLTFPEGVSLDYRLLNPYLCAKATKYYSEIIMFAYLSNKLFFDEITSLKEKLTVAEKFSNLYGANQWFKNITLVCSEPDILKLAIEKYLGSVEQLHYYLYSTLDFKSVEIVDEAGKLLFHNQLNSSLFIEEGVTSRNCFVPSLDKVEDNFTLYLNEYNDIIEKYSRIIDKSKDFQIEQKVIGLIGNQNLDTNIDYNFNTIGETNYNVKIRLQFNCKDENGKNTLWSFNVIDNRYAEVEKLKIDISENELGNGWYTVRIKYVENLGNGNAIFILGNPTPKSDHILFVHYGWKYYYLSKGLYQENLLERFRSVFQSSQNILKDFINNENELKMSISFPSSEIKTYSTIDAEYLTSLIENCRSYWNKLSTALLCFSNNYNDFSQYFNLLASKPAILELPTKINEHLISSITGSELEKLYLVNTISFNNRTTDSDPEKPIGLKILDQVTLTNDLLAKEKVPDTVQFNEIHFIKEGNEGIAKFKTDDKLVDELFRALTTISVHPLAMPSITASSEDAIDACENAMSALFELNYNVVYNDIEEVK